MRSATKDRIESFMLTSLICGAVIATACFFGYRTAVQRGAIARAHIFSRVWESSDTHSDSANNTHSTAAGITIAASR